MKSRWKLSALAAVGLALAALGGIAYAERVQVGKLILDVNGGFSPSGLPKKAFAPITLRAQADISTTDGSVPPTLAHLTIDFDRNGLLTTKGLPTCQPSRLENTVPNDARKACRAAIVGTGFASAQVVFPDQAPVPANSPLTIFNGPRRGGNPSVIIHAYVTIPAPTTFVIHAPVTRANGRYRYRVSTDIPPIAGGYGSLTHFDFKIRKIYRSKGKRLSYASARCKDGRLQARGELRFSDGTLISGSVIRPCKQKK